MVVKGVEELRHGDLVMFTRGLREVASVDMDKQTGDGVTLVHVTFTKGVRPSQESCGYYKGELVLTVGD